MGSEVVLEASCRRVGSFRGRMVEYRGSELLMSWVLLLLVYLSLLFWAMKEGDLPFLLLLLLGDALDEADAVDMMMC